MPRLAISCLCIVRKFCVLSEPQISYQQSGGNAINSFHSWGKANVACFPLEFSMGHTGKLVTVLLSTNCEPLKVRNWVALFGKFTCLRTFLGIQLCAQLGDCFEHGFRLLSASCPLLVTCLCSWLVQSLLLRLLGCNSRISLVSKIAEKNRS